MGVSTVSAPDVLARTLCFYKRVQSDVQVKTQWASAKVANTASCEFYVRGFALDCPEFYFSWTYVRRFG
jgi:hypothetical protein